MKKVLDGCTAVSQIAYKMSELLSIYPITPASPMASNADKLSHEENNLFGTNSTVVEMQSEAGAIGTLHGALLTGTLASTFTASQGLLLMIPNMYKIAGEELPAVIHVASRTVASHALSIFGDHSDIYAVRQTGFCMLASSSVQEAQDMAAVAHLSAIRSSMPFLHFMDGFRTSHEINKITTIEDEDLLKLVDQNRLESFRDRALNIENPVSKGLAENEDIYFQSVEARTIDYELVPDIVADYMKKIGKLTGHDYAPFNYYGSKDAKYVIVAMGSVTKTIEKVIEDLNKKGGSYGLVTVHLYRPWNSKYLEKVLPKSVRRIAVLDRTCEHGSAGEPLYQDVLASLKDTNITVVGGRYGLASKNTTPRDIKAIFMMLEENPKEKFTIGIEDDVNETSLEVEEYDLPTRNKEMVIYGYGSDGMVSAAKDILKIAGKDEKTYVQGYFEYDSKKSGGVTVSHTRFGIEPIDLPYYPEKINVLVITKENYLAKFDVTKNIQKNGILLVNTNREFSQLTILASIKKDIEEKNLTVFTIDADRIAEENGLKGKISLVMETILLRILGIDDAEEELEKSIEKRFATKGANIVLANKKCMKSAIENLKSVSKDLNNDVVYLEEGDIFDKISSRRGNEIPVSELLEYRTGTFPGGLSKLEKRSVATLVPKWKSENCIQCGMCSLVCPHAVIRPFIVEEDSENARDGISLLGGDGKYKYLISVSLADCTGCGLCIAACPGKNGEKALAFGEKEAKEQRLANTLFNFYKNPQLYDKFTIKGSQLEKPQFEFSGACSGCGETPYLKLLTQLFGENLVIANATGCSSIYGGSAPSTTYSIPWANSLFEDNAEFSYGMLKGYQEKRKKIAHIMEESIESVSEVTRELYYEWLDSGRDLKTAKKVKEELAKNDIPKELVELLPYIVRPSIWAVGGDGWAYDIGFSGIDHILSTNEDINILVLDTEVYSNTGGQASKSSRLGQVAEFTDLGKKTEKKDLFKIAMAIPNVYVASVALGANMFQTIKAFKEAEEHDGPSIIIAYSPCIEQGIKSGMNCSLKEQRLAVECGYELLMRYDSEKLTIDSKEPNFDKYEEFLEGEVRYNALKLKDPEIASELFEKNLEASKRRYAYYKKWIENQEN